MLNNGIPTNGRNVEMNYRNSAILDEWPPEPVELPHRCGYELGLPGHCRHPSHRDQSQVVSHKRPLKGTKPVGRLEPRGLTGQPEVSKSDQISNWFSRLPPLQAKRPTPPQSKSQKVPPKAAKKAPAKTVKPTRAAIVVKGSRKAIPRFPPYVSGGKAKTK
jgi:hypothetical protein